MSARGCKPPGCVRLLDGGSDAGHSGVPARAAPGRQRRAACRRNCGSGLRWTPATGGRSGRANGSWRRSVATLSTWGCRSRRHGLKWTNYRSWRPFKRCASLMLTRRPPAQTLALVGAVLGKRPMRLAGRVAGWAHGGRLLWILTGDASTGKTAVAGTRASAATAAAAAERRPRWMAPGCAATRISRAWPTNPLARRRWPGKMNSPPAEHRVPPLRQTRASLRDTRRSLGEAAGGLGNLLDYAGSGWRGQNRQAKRQPDCERQTVTPDSRASVGSKPWTTSRAPRYGSRVGRNPPLDEAGSPMRRTRALFATRMCARACVRWLGSGNAVPTLREVLAVRRFRASGDWTCEGARQRHNQARSAFTAEESCSPRARPPAWRLRPLSARRCCRRCVESGLGDVADFQLEQIALTPTPRVRSASSQAREWSCRS